MLYRLIFLSKDKFNFQAPEERFHYSITPAINSSSHQLNMFSDAVVAINGSKVKASNNKANNYTPRKLEAEFVRVEKHISKYLSQLDKSDDNEKMDTSPIEEKIAWLKIRLTELRGLKDKVEADNVTRLSLFVVQI